jgi:hypothetical protein
MQLRLPDGLRSRRALFPVLLVSWLLGPQCRSARQTAFPEMPALPVPEFAELLDRLSEPGGYFPADNLVSNETSYLEVAETLADRFPTGGVYLGVGPDQNFNYIARLRPRWAFILDIRRQNLLQHLMYNAFFAEAADPYQFLCRLLSRPCPEQTPKAALLGIESMLTALDEVKPTPAELAKVEHAVIRHVQGRLGVPLAEDDQRELRLILRSFYEQQLQIRFRSSSRPSWLPLPSYRELLLVRSPSGRYGHYLASLEDYRFVRELERARRVVPVVGDFAGPHALKAIGRELKARGETVTAFYLSNVEFYLFRGGVFERFLENLGELPLREEDGSVLIRACFGFGRPHPLAQPGRISVTLLQPIPRYIALGSAGRYGSDWDACLIDYMTDGPSRPLRLASPTVTPFASAR